MKKQGVFDLPVWLQLGGLVVLVLSFPLFLYLGYVATKTPVGPFWRWPALLVGIPAATLLVIIGLGVLFAATGYTGGMKFTIITIRPNVIITLIGTIAATMLDHSLVASAAFMFLVLAGFWLLVDVVLDITYIFDRKKPSPSVVSRRRKLPSIRESLVGLMRMLLTLAVVTGLSVAVISWLP